MSARLDEFEARLRALRRAGLVGLAERSREFADAVASLERGEPHALEALRRLAHKLRGIAANLGRADLGVDAAELERAIAAGDATARIGELGRALAAKTALAASDAAVATEEAPATEQGRLRVLAVDDDPVSARLVALVLGQAKGWDVRVFGAPREALTVLASYAPELVIVDAQMPELDGRAFYAEVRRVIGPTPCVIILSAATSDELGWTMPDDRRLGWMRKPIRPASWIDELRAFVAQAAARAP